MTSLRIYNLAMDGLLREREFEETKLSLKPDSKIVQHRVSVLDKEINELHEMIIKEESVTV